VRLRDRLKAMKLTPLMPCILLTSLGFLCVPAQAQFRTVVNGRGNIVFTNDTSPAPSRTTKTDPTDKVAGAAAPAPKAATGKPTAPPNLRSTTAQELDRIVQRTAEKHHVDPRLVRAVIVTESNWNPGAVSRKGAQGLMQLNPDTAEQLGVDDAFDPAQNVDGGVRYLGMMLDRYNGDVHRALAAYNAGPGAVDRSGGIPRIPETQNYVQKVTSLYIGGAGLRPRTVEAPIQIYRVVEADGRVVFRNE
jgi:soluble lytic murein transglycosylase-like protein